MLARAAGLDLGVVRETLIQSAADSRFIRHAQDTLFVGDFMRSFGLDRCYEELQTVTELAHDFGVPFQLSETVTDVYRRAVRRYGSVDGELLSIALLEEQAGSYDTPRPARTPWDRPRLANRRTGDERVRSVWRAASCLPVRAQDQAVRQRGTAAVSMWVGVTYSRPPRLGAGQAFRR